MKKSSVLVHEPPAIDPSADTFRSYEQAFMNAQDQSKRALKTEAAGHRQKQVKEMIAYSDGCQPGIPTQSSR